MHPEISISLLSLELIEISAYRLFFILACTATLSISLFFICQKNLPLKKASAVLLCMALAVPIGARILHAATNISMYQQNPAKLWALQLTGFSLMGGLIVSAIVGLFWRKCSLLIHGS